MKNSITISVDLHNAVPSGGEHMSDGHRAETLRNINSRDVAMMLDVAAREVREGAREIAVGKTAWRIDWDTVGS